MKIIVVLGIIGLFTLTSYQSLAQVKESLIEKVEIAKDTIETPLTSAFDPLSLSATIVWGENKGQLAMIMKANMLEDWHAYAYVPEDMPYINTEIKFEVPAGLTPIGEWEEPDPKLYEDGVFIYQGEFCFVRYFEVDNQLFQSKSLKCGLYYQTCDLEQCLPPKTKMVEVEF